METKPQATPAKKPIAWDEYFPLINKGVMFLVLILAIVFASGLDFAALANKVLSRDGGATSVAAAPAGEPVSSGFKGFTLSVWGPGGWKVAVVLVAVILGIAAFSLSVLSTSGRDAAQMKEQAAKAKEDRKCKPTGGTDASQAESTECNLASYKMFFSSPEEPVTPAESPAKSASA